MELSEEHKQKILDAVNEKYAFLKDGEVMYREDYNKFKEIIKEEEEDVLV